ncbi:hypothetical protein BpHYR1_044724 [Brachionus plicatilis]|uniref:Uncharacterized protein n=1 Tax=Brachionus plicatilis TaxID=10195 RepID=A0A3M7QRY3_BRAPC|nr:hypothetical protein BpHYR1_044724 [Brachionus plicatilis]
MNIFCLIVGSITSHYFKYFVQENFFLIKYYIFVTVKRQKTTLNKIIAPKLFLHQVAVLIITKTVINIITNMAFKSSLDSNNIFLISYNPIFGYFISSIISPILFVCWKLISSVALTRYYQKKKFTIKIFGETTENENIVPAGIN